MAAVVNQTSPGSSEEHGLEVRGSSEHISGHGDAEGHADVVRMTHGFEESWVDVLQNPKAEERDNSRLICGLVGPDYTLDCKKKITGFSLILNERLQEVMWSYRQEEKSAERTVIIKTRVIIVN